MAPSLTPPFPFPSPFKAKWRMITARRAFQKKMEHLNSLGCVSSSLEPIASKFPSLCQWYSRPDVLCHFPLAQAPSAHASKTLPRYVPCATRNIRSAPRSLVQYSWPVHLLMRTFLVYLPAQRTRPGRLTSRGWRFSASRKLSHFVFRYDTLFQTGRPRRPPPPLPKDVSPHPSP